MKKSKNYFGFVVELQPLNNLTSFSNSVATLFTSPDPTIELAKCQRYYLHTTGNIDPVDLRPSMLIVHTVTQLDSGNYAYNAELQHKSVANVLHNRYYVNIISWQ